MQRETKIVRLVSIFIPSQANFRFLKHISGDGSPNPRFFPLPLSQIPFFIRRRNLIIFHRGRWFLNGRRRQRLDAVSSILASAEQSIPHLDETDCCIDVVDVQNVNLIHLIVTFASVDRHRAIFPTSPSCVFKADADFHRPIPESNFLTEVSGLDARSAAPPDQRPSPAPRKQARLSTRYITAPLRKKRRFFSLRTKGNGRHRSV